MIQATKDIIYKAVDSEYLLEIKDEILGFLNRTPTQMLTPNKETEKEPWTFQTPKHC